MVPALLVISPTATQAEGERHEIPGRLSATNAPLCLLGIGRIDQPEPFHASAYVSACEGPASPTAIQSSGTGHETPYSRAPTEPATGFASSDHALPFQPSVSGSVGPAGSVPPTAVHACADGHDTPLKAP